MQVFSIVISAFRTELFSAATFPTSAPSSPGDRDLPLGVCFYQESDDDIYGDRICNNAMAASVVSILVAIVLLMIDLQVPCVSSTVSEQCNVVLWYCSSNIVSLSLIDHLGCHGNYSTCDNT